ncbi:hypothetical protein Dda_5349 [Drechslerella dactyloides]|uniref:S-adenosyl-L-methionine-dependent methyltransferase n=1 Tax=Drechslerella dactyloides TaxID=74499 RepID=A0AAD6J059_DREDA|nr:hypothetical protein Dda_5349 [Drechslerella dactyloides]
MPRLPPHLLAVSRNQHPLLPLLLRQTRTLPLALSELRWLREHVSQPPHLASSPRLQHAHLVRLCRRRALGVPLQYLLRTQPFGDVDILCGAGALIPRPETEEMVLRFFNALKSHIHIHKPQDTNTHTSTNINRDANLQSNRCLPTHRELRVLDLCTGPGSIALLATSKLHTLQLPRGYRVLGIDISPAALTLARRSLEYNIAKGALPAAIRQNISFIKADLLTRQDDAYAAISRYFGDGEASVDIIVSNPPYVSPEGYWKDTARSVRLYEPEIALVPPPVQPRDDTRREDVFYPAIATLARRLHAQALVLETGGNEQSSRVKDMLRSRNWETGIWIDFAGIHRNVAAWQHPNWRWLAQTSSTYQ